MAGAGGPAPSRLTRPAGGWTGLPGARPLAGSSVAAPASARQASQSPVAHPILALVVLCLSVVLVAMDNMIINVALPTISEDLDASTKDLQWIVDGYVVAFAALLLVGGYLGDRFGHRLMLALGLIGFVASSWWATQLSDVNGLITARVVMGVCAAMLYPCTLALLTRVFSGPRLPMAIGVWSGVSGAGVALGPIIGGALLEHFTWPSVFWVNVPLAAVALVAGLVVFRGMPHRRRAGRFDALGSLLSVAGIAMLVFAIIEAPTWGWRDRSTLLAFALAAVLILAFAARELTARHPLLDLRLLARPAISAAAGCISMAHFALFGFIFAITMYFQLVKDWSTLEAGLATLPYAVVMAAISPVAMLIAGRVGNRTVIAGGMLLMSGGLMIATTASADSPYWPVVVPAMVTMAAGMALAVGPATAMLMDAMPEGFAGVGSGINDTTREVGGALGVALVGSVLNSMFRSRIDEDFADLGLPQQAIDPARESLGAAIGVSEQLPPQVAQPAYDAAIEAFTQAMHGGTWVAVGGTVLSALLAVVAVPRMRRAQTQERTP